MNDTTALQTTPAVRAYLRRATWGLPRERQQEVWDELEEHLLTRAAQLQACGASPPAALDRALAELGSPARVSAGMTGVYLMPKLILMASAGALALSAALYALAGGSERTPPITLNILTQKPVKPSCVRGTKPSGNNITIVSEKDGISCYTFNDAASYLGVYLKGTEIASAIKAQGGRATVRGNNLDIALPGTGTGGGSVNARFSIEGQPYFDATSVISGLGTPLPIQFSGYETPSVQIGQVNLRFGTGTQTLGRAFYNPLFSLFLGALTGAKGQAAMSINGGYFVTSPGSLGVRHRVSTTLQPGEVVLLVTKRAGNNYMTDTAEVDASGTVAVQSDASKVRFVSSMDQLGPYPSGGRTNALLVRVTNIPLNNLKAGIFVPVKATSDAN